jgi:hypothetical protein
MKATFKRLLAVISILTLPAWFLTFWTTCISIFGNRPGQGSPDNTTFWVWIVMLAYIPGVPVVDYILTECRTIKKVIKWMFN